ncbi:MAG: pseudouridine synthase [Emticicia sp.]
MTFRNRLQYLLVVRLQISNKEALNLIFSGKILVNNIATKSNVELTQTDEVVYEGQILQEAKKLIYIAYYKPRGIETTLNVAIKDNLKAILPFEEAIFPVGRLDKESEGLLLLTNDGTVYDRILRNENKTEKDYIVEVNKLITADFLEKMSSGMIIIGKKTLPCKLIQMDDFTFKITLIQGLNRQIRRMCYKLDYEVLSLKRVRIGEVELGNLKAEEYQILEML